MKKSLFPLTCLAMLLACAGPAQAQRLLWKQSGHSQFAAVLKSLWQTGGLHKTAALLPAKEIHYSWGGTNWNYKYNVTNLYGPKGLDTLEIARDTVNGQDQYKDITRLDAQGNLILLESYQLNSSTGMLEQGESYRFALTYDAQNRITQVKRETYDPSSGYVEDLRLTAITYSSGTISAIQAEFFDGSSWMKARLTNIKMAANPGFWYAFQDETAFDAYLGQEFNGMKWKDAFRVSTSRSGDTTIRTSESYDNGWMSDEIDTTVLFNQGNSTQTTYAYFDGSGQMYLSRYTVHSDLHGNDTMTFGENFDSGKWNGPYAINRYLHTYGASGELMETIGQISYQQAPYQNSTRIVYSSFGLFTSLQEKHLPAAAFTLYPNPARDAIYVRGKGMQNASVQLSDLQGRSVLSLKAEATGEGCRISLPQLANGVYLLQVQTPQGMIRERVMIAE